MTQPMMRNGHVLYPGYYAKNPLRWYIVSIWDFNVPVKADSHGAARYEAWLNFHDAYDLPFGEFCKQSRVVRA